MLCCLEERKLQEWCMEMFNALQAKRKIGFIDGTLQKPIDGRNNLDAWLSVNSMIVDWIYLIFIWSKSVINCDVYLWCSQVVGISQKNRQQSSSSSSKISTCCLYVDKMDKSLWSTLAVCLLRGKSLKLTSSAMFACVELLLNSSFCCLSWAFWIYTL